MNAKGLVHKYGDNVDTDVIIPARYLNTADHKELAAHCMEDIDKDFTKNVKDGDIMVGGANFGCGSSREHAALVPLYLGIKAVIAKSFARIHVANLINFGIVPLTLENEEDYELLSERDELVIEGFREAISKKDYAVVKNKTTGRECSVRLSFTERQRAILLSGGLLNYTKRSAK